MVLCHFLLLNPLVHVPYFKCFTAGRIGDFPRRLCSCGRIQVYESHPDRFPDKYEDYQLAHGPLLNWSHVILEVNPVTCESDTLLSELLSIGTMLLFRGTTNFISNVNI